MKIGIACFGHGLGATGGLQVYVRDLLDALGRQRDPRDQYALLVGPREEAPAWAARPGFSLVRVSDPGFAGGPLVGRALRLVFEACPEIERLGLDVLHYPATRVLHPLQRTPVVLTFFDMQEEFLPFFAWRARLARRVLHRYGVRRARVVIAPSAFTAECLRERYGTPASKIVLVPPGVTEELFEPPRPTERNLLRELRLEPGSFALYPANPWPHKNHERLLAAWAQLAPRDGAVPLLVCTGRVAGEARSVAALARAAGLDEARVRDLGFVTAAQLLALLRGARCLVFPSLFEGAGLPVAEALAAGCPVACSDLPPLREIADGAARFFDPLRPSAIAEAVSALWDDGGLRAELRALGRAKVAPRRWAALVPALRAAYAQALEVR